MQNHSEIDITNAESSSWLPSGTKCPFFTPHFLVPRGDPPALDSGLAAVSQAAYCLTSKYAEVE